MTMQLDQAWHNGFATSINNNRASGCFKVGLGLCNLRDVAALDEDGGRPRRRTGTVEQARVAHHDSPFGLHEARGHRHPT